MQLRESDGVRSRNFDSFGAWVNHEGTSAPDLPIRAQATHRQA